MEDTTSKFVRLQTACAALKESISTIYDNALSNEELNRLASSNDDMQRMIAGSPAMIISTSLVDAKSKFDIAELFNHYKFNDDIFEKKELFNSPVIEDSDLAETVLEHRELIVSERTEDNEALRHVGVNWLKALVTEILYKMFPYANIRSFVNVEDDILSDMHLSVLTSQIPLFDRFEEHAMKNPNVTQLSSTKLCKIKADCFKSFIGALVVDNNNVTAAELKVWLGTFLQPLIQKIKMNHINGLYAKDPREQLVLFMQNNKFGLELRFKTEVKTGETTLCKIYMGNTLLASGEGADDFDAEQNAASAVLMDDSAVIKYSMYDINREDEDDYYTEETTEESIPSKPVHREIRTSSTVVTEKKPKTPSKEPTPAELVEYEKSDEEMRALPLNTTSSKTDKATLYRIIGEYKSYPQYITLQLGLNDFYSSCHVLNRPHSYLGEGRGSNKKIAEQTAATEALEKKLYKKIFATDNEEDDEDFVHLLSDNEEEDTSGEHTKSSDSTNTVDNFKPFQASYFVDLELHNTCDPNAKAALYGELGRFGYIPDYTTQENSPTDFYSFCTIKNTSVIIGEGRGRSKKIAEQISAANAFSGEALSDFLV